MTSRASTISGTCFLLLLLLTLSILALMFLWEETRFVQVKRYRSVTQKKLAVDSAFDKIDPQKSSLLSPVSSWSQTEDGQVCSTLLNNNGRVLEGYGPSGAWNLLRHQILSASYFPKEHASRSDFREWVHSIFSFHTTERLRRSVAHSASNKTMRKLLRLIAESAASTSTESRTIRILVMGGSVTFGQGCLTNSEVRGLPNISRSTCSWPTRLEYLLNQVFFSGREEENKVFEVINYAQGATNSEVAASLLENQLISHLFDDKGRLPDIVISSYSTNDSQDPDLNVTFHEHLQNFVRAAHKLRPCDDDLPLVLMADDLHGRKHLTISSLEHTGNLYKIASWYNVMAVNYANVARHQAIAYYVDESKPNPLFGSPWDNSHLGMGLHMGMAWTVLFNLLTAIQETCSDTDSSTDVDIKEEYDLVVSQKQISHNVVAAANVTRKWSLFEPPTKYQGSIDTMDNVANEWRENRARKEEQCANPHTTNASPASLPSSFSTNVCAYAWVADRDTIYEPKHITRALEGVLKASNGWNAKNYTTAYKSRSPGFGTDVPASSFQLELCNITLDTHYLTVFSMASYGPGFVGSKLELNVQVIRGTSSTNPNSSSTTIRAKEEDHNNIDTGTYMIPGYHTLKTSVYFPHKFRLPGGGAKAGRGDSILVQGKLVSGRTFKITGMAFCE